MSTRPMVGCRVPPDWKARLEALAAESGRNTSQVVYEAIATFLEEGTQGPSKTTAQDLQRRLEALESDASLTALTHSQQTLAQRVAILDKIVASLSAQVFQGSAAGKVMLTSEELASILGVTPRAVNQAAEKGKAHFQVWIKRFKQEHWDFEVLNGWAKKHDRRFFRLP